MIEAVETNVRLQNKEEIASLVAESPQVYTFDNLTELTGFTKETIKLILKTNKVPLKYVKDFIPKQVRLEMLIENEPGVYTKEDLIEMLEIQPNTFKATYWYKLTKEQKEMIKGYKEKETDISRLRLFLKENRGKYTVKEVAEKTGLSVRKVNNAITRKFVPRDSFIMKERRATKFNPKLQRVLDLINNSEEKLTRSEIYDKTGISTSTLSNYIVQGYIKKEDLLTAKEKNRIERVKLAETIESMLKAEPYKISMAILSERLGRTKASLLYLIQEYNIDTSLMSKDKQVNIKETKIRRRQEEADEIKANLVKEKLTCVEYAIKHGVTETKLINMIKDGLLDKEDFKEEPVVLTKTNKIIDFVEKHPGEFTKAQVAKHVGVSASAVSKVIKRNNVSQDMFAKPKTKAQIAAELAAEQAEILS